MSLQLKLLARPGLAAVLLLGASLPGTALSQNRRFFFATPPAGSEDERRARAADLLDSTSRKQWTIRPLLAGDPTSRTGLTEPSVSLFENSAFPWGFNDGPVWAGRGITTAS